MYIYICIYVLYGTYVTIKLSLAGGESANKNEINYVETFLSANTAGYVVINTKCSGPRQARGLGMEVGVGIVVAGGMPKVESLPQCRCPKLNLIKISFAIANAIEAVPFPLNPHFQNCGSGQLARTRTIRRTSLRRRQLLCLLI